MLRILYFIFKNKIYQLLPVSMCLNVLNINKYVFIFVTGMPTVEEVCSSFGLTDVEIPYTDADYENLTSYKLFQQHVRPMIVKENPKVIYCK